MAIAVLAGARPVAAGGNEFPADGTRGLGRGGTGFLRADDPSVMMRNPALLADLADDQLLLGAHFLLPDACFRATGHFGWGVQGVDASDFGDGASVLQAPPGSTDLEGNPIEGYNEEPFPEVCYSGPMPFLPSLALSHRLSDTLGVGLGFFAPETLALSQFGNPDGTVDTPQGKRPNPTRYYRSHLNVSFFTLTGAIGYRPVEWLRIGAGFQWTLVVFEARTWSAGSDGRSPRTDVSTDVFGRDLFVPGFVASVHVVPHDNLELGVGFKWQDNLDSKAKLDLTSGQFGVGAPTSYVDPNGVTQTVGSSIPTLTSNQPGRVVSTPVWAPQLSFGIRYAQRLRPRSHAAHGSSDEPVEDHMASELFDLEFTAVYYFNSVFDASEFRSRSAVIDLRSVNAAGVEAPGTATVGVCEKSNASGECVGDYVTALELRGQNLWSLRVGGDYNVLPGVLALRAGLSHEGDGAERAFMDIHNYAFRRTGLHAGFTWRVGGRTDISFAYAHFFLDDVKLQVNPRSAFPQLRRTAEYGFEPGLGEGSDEANGFDAVAGREVPYKEPNSQFVNAGRFAYELDVLSLAFTQHF